MFSEAGAASSGDYPQAEPPGHSAPVTGQDNDPGDEHPRDLRSEVGRRLLLPLGLVLLIIAVIEGIAADWLRAAAYGAVGLAIVLLRAPGIARDTRTRTIAGILFAVGIGLIVVMVVDDFT